GGAKDQDRDGLAMVERLHGIPPILMVRGCDVARGDENGPGRVSPVARRATPSHPTRSGSNAASRVVPVLFRFGSMMPEASSPRRRRVEEAIAERLVALSPWSSFL